LSENIGKEGIYCVVASEIFLEQEQLIHVVKDSVEERAQ